MKLYRTDLDGLRAIFEFVKNCNPPDGKTKEEMVEEFKDIVVKHQIFKMT